MMNGRRAFLGKAGALTLLSSFSPSLLRSDALASAQSQAPIPAKRREPIGWKPHFVKQGDGRGGWITHSAEYQFLVHQEVGRHLFPYGVRQMDNGEVILAAAWDSGNTKGLKDWKLVVAFSRDGARSWTEFATIPNAPGRPAVVTYLGKGNLILQSEVGPSQYFSSDYGRTWPERRPLQPAGSGGSFDNEGDALVDVGAGGTTRLAGFGLSYPKGTKWPFDPGVGLLRWSNDGGRTWTNETAPKEWLWQEEYQGKTYQRGVSECSIIRAANGWLVAALRSDMPARYLDIVPHNDSLEGLGVSVSKDDGVTWSPLRILYEAGRHHGHLLRLPGGDLVMVLIVRADVQNGRLASYHRGLEAIISRDNGLTWDLAHKYVLDDYEYYDGVEWFNGDCGHCSTTLLDNGFILSTYANYLTRGASLILWKPAPA